jgi:hypothetical protein
MFRKKVLPQQIEPQSEVLSTCVARTASRGRRVKPSEIEIVIDPKSGAADADLILAFHFLDHETHGGITHGS